jgi:hypothetical protein
MFDKQEVGGGEGVWTTILNANMNKMKRIEGKSLKVWRTISKTRKIEDVSMRFERPMNMNRTKRIKGGMGNNKQQNKKD